jgi:hypothetical protein
VYSLVGASLLGFDLARRPGGAGTARVLGWALGVRPDDVPVLDRLHDETVARDAAWMRLSAAVGGGADLLTVLATTPWATTDPAEALRLLSGAPVGSLDGLLRLVRDDVFDWLTVDPVTEPAVAAAAAVRTGQGTVALVSDAVVAGYAAGHLAPTDRRTLISPWLAAVRRIGERPVDLGPADATIHGLLARVARATPRDRARLGLACDALRSGPQPWAAAMHRATWVAHLTDRVRAGAAGQLAAVAALHAAGVTATECAAGAWNAVSAGVAALTVADLLGDEELRTLLDPVAGALEIRLP